MPTQGVPHHHHVTKSMKRRQAEEAAARRERLSARDREYRAALGLDPDAPLPNVIGKVSRNTTGRKRRPNP